MSFSCVSSDPPDKPSDCPPETWQILAEAVNETDVRYDTDTIIMNLPVSNCVNQTVRLEITDVDEDGLIHQNEQDIPLILFVNEQNDENVLIVNKCLSCADKNNNAATEQQTMEIVNEEYVIKNRQENMSQKEPNLNDPDSVKELTKKRQKNPKLWKQNMRKEKRQHGEEYINVNGQRVPPRSVSEKVCHSGNCTFKCSQVISREERELIHKHFWHLNDEKKLHYYSKHITRTLASRKRTKEATSKKAFSYQYFFVVSGVKVRVCQEFFLHTLNISKQRVYYFFKKCQNDATQMPLTPLQGKHKKKVISEQRKNEVRNHIKSFPTVPSHYCRSTSKKQYLERNLNVRKMYELYTQQTHEPVKFHVYENIFKTEFNIAFFKPKKDMCDKCAEYTFKKQPTDEETKKYNEHIHRKNIGNLERQNDRIRYKNDETVGIVTFDLENTFALPKTNVSSNFYKMKLSCYNFTAHCNRNNTVYNAIWHECLCGRAGVHIACALIKILKEVAKDNPNIKKLILWSDSCIPQNKNSIMSLALLCFLKSEECKNIEIIEQKFGEPGHGNVQEIDSAHIERKIRNLEIWTPLTLVRILLSIPNSWKQKFRVLQMKPSDYYDYQTVSNKYNFNTIPYTKVKHLIYERAFLLQVKYHEAFDGPMYTSKLKYIRRVNITKEVVLPDTVPRITNMKIMLNEQKRKHLRDMLPHMPEEDREFYYAIGISRNK